MVEIPRQLPMFIVRDDGELIYAFPLPTVEENVVAGTSLPGWKTSGAITSDEVANNPDKYRDEKPGGWN